MKRFQNEALLSALKGANSVFLCTHIAPDGDAIGSMLAAGRTLRRMGKQAVMCCADSIPEKFLFLPGAREIRKPEGLDPDAFDLAFSLDAADLGRIGRCAEVYERIPLRIQIDHHGTNPAYADQNEIDAAAAAAGCIVMRLLRALDIPVDRETAECLYTAISTDTGNFCFSCADREVFEIMAELLDAGIELAPLARQLHLMREKEYLGLLGRALGSMRFLMDGQVTVTKLTPEDYAAVQARPEHADGIVNYWLYIPGVRITCFADGRLPGETKLSLRAMPPYSAADIAVRLGGGGHVAAAGCRVEKPLDEAIELVLQAIREEMERHS